MILGYGASGILEGMREPTADELQQKLYEIYQAYLLSTKRLHVPDLRWLMAASSWKVLTDDFYEVISVFGIPLIPISAEPGYTQLIDIRNNKVIS